jgi:hypothetical protein
MRRPATTLMLATGGLLAVAAVAALAAELVASAGAPVARGAPGARWTRPPARGVDAGTGARTWPLALSPAPDDLALAQVSFRRSGRGRLPVGSLGVAVSGPFGSDYMAAAVPSFATPGAVHVLVLVVNRPSALLDPAVARLRVDAPDSLGAATARTLENPFARAKSAPRPALCDLPVRRTGLNGDELAPLSSRGSSLAGFDAAGAVAQGYDVACGLPHASAFEHAVARSSPAAPSPAPPVGKLPGEGCKPAPGYACPG